MVEMKKRFMGLLLSNKHILKLEFEDLQKLLKLIKYHLECCYDKGQTVNVYTTSHRPIIAWVCHDIESREKYAPELLKLLYVPTMSIFCLQDAINDQTVEKCVETHQKMAEVLAHRKIYTNSDREKSFLALFEIADKEIGIDHDWNAQMISKEWHDKALIACKNGLLKVPPIDNSNLFADDKRTQLNQSVLDSKAYYGGCWIKPGDQFIDKNATNSFILVTERSWASLVASFGYRNELHSIKVQLVPVRRATPKRSQYYRYGKDYDVTHLQPEDWDEYYISFEENQVWLSVRLDGYCDSGVGPEYCLDRFDSTMPLSKSREWVSYHQKQWWCDKHFNVLHKTVDGRRCNCFICVESSQLVDFKDGDNIVFVLTSKK